MRYLSLFCAREWSVVFGQADILWYLCIIALRSNLPRGRSRHGIRMYRPSKQELIDAADKTLSDVIRPGLSVLFCGINPGLYTAATGHHFGRPGNRFWRALYESGFTPRLLDPSEQWELLPLGLGITNLVPRATVAASELSRQELIEGGIRLERTAKEFAPIWIAFVGVGAYRTAFDRPHAALGRQVERIANSGIWVLPSTSGLNANHRPADFARAFRELKSALE